MLGYKENDNSPTNLEIEIIGIESRVWEMRRGEKLNSRRSCDSCNQAESVELSLFWPAHINGFSFGQAQCPAANQGGPEYAYELSIYSLNI